MVNFTWRTYTAVGNGPVGNSVKVHCDRHWKAHEFLKLHVQCAIIASGQIATVVLGIRELTDGSDEDLLIRIATNSCGCKAVWLDNPDTILVLQEMVEEGLHQS